jgi:hypothetical protein
VERSFADAKQLDGHRYARMRGLVNVREQMPAGRNGTEHQENRAAVEPHGTESEAGATSMAAAPTSDLRNAVASAP